MHRGTKADRCNVMQLRARRPACLVEGLGVVDGNRSVPNDSIIFPASSSSIVVFASSGKTDTKQQARRQRTTRLLCLPQLIKMLHGQLLLLLIAAESPSERSTRGSVTFYTSSPQLAGRSCTLNQAASISSETWEQHKYAHLGRKRFSSAGCRSVNNENLLSLARTASRPSENPGIAQFLAILYLDSYMVLSVAQAERS